MLIHVEASCLFVDLCLSPMLPLLNSEEVGLAEYLW